jgi:uncharacterized protein with PQ loop repeat
MDVVGVTAMVLEICWAFAMLTQTHKILRMKSTKAFSVTPYLVGLVVAVYWSTYGVRLANWPLVVAHIALVSSSASVVIVYYIHELKGK